MTKEEAIQIIDSLDPAVMIKTTASNKQIREAIDMAVGALSQPSLPPNLDGAANNYGVDIRLGYPRVMDETGRYIYNAFKAGAKWMAEQGVTREVEVKEDAGGYPYIDKHFELYDYDKDEPLFKAGDKVVVQIRKK